MTDKLQRPPGTTSKLATPKDVENELESHRRLIDQLTRTVNDLVDKLRAAGVAGV